MGYVICAFKESGQLPEGIVKAMEELTQRYSLVVMANDAPWDKWGQFSLHN